MASTALVKSVSGYVITNVKFQDKMYDSTKLSVLDDLCVDIILGLNFQTQHDSVKFKFNGNNHRLQYVDYQFSMLSHQICFVNFHMTVSQ